MPIIVRKDLEGYILEKRIRYAILSNEPHHEKTCLRGLKPGVTQTRLYNLRRWLEV